MKMLQRLLGRSPQPPHARSIAPGPADVEDPAGGCGWFDSSHELEHGLWVLEHATPDAVANDLPLGEWLQLHVAASQPAARG